MKHKIGIASIIIGIVVMIISAGKTVLPFLEETFGIGGYAAGGSVILGGADGPTTMFVAGKASSGSVLFIVIGIILIAIGIVLTLMKDKK